MNSLWFCVTPRPGIGPSGDESRDASYDEQHQLSADRPFEVAA